MLEAKPGKNLNDLENLSEISSTEDEEWQRLAVTDNDENSQLVSNDGEVRYPVRSWLTPIKEHMLTETSTKTSTESAQPFIPKETATIKVTLPLKSTEKRNRQVKELELKRERIREKLKIDATTIPKKDKPTTSTNITAAKAASRIIHAMRDKGKKPACFETPQNSAEITTVKSQHINEEQISIDVLTALNLSAKKQILKTPEDNTKTRLPISKLAQPAASDNAIALTISPEILNKTKEMQKFKNKLNISPSAVLSKTPQRKCLPIEARPVTRTIKKAGKKIVRTPLAFKTIHSPGKINSHSTTTTLAELAATKTIASCKPKDSLNPFMQQAVRVSPRLMKPKKPRARKASPESQPQKIKISPKNPRRKTTAVKPKVTHTRNRNKETPPLDREMKELLADWKEESVEKEMDKEEEEDIAQHSTGAATKPKIHLKAKNAMISPKSKTKPVKMDQNPVEIKQNVMDTIAKVPSKPKQDLDLEHREIRAEITPCLPAAAPPPSPTKPPPPPPTLQQPPVVAETEDCSEDDPLEDCEMTTIDETDTKRFFHYTYQGPDQPPAVAPQKYDFSNFQMVVAIDENENHIWRITEGICLFSSIPTPAPVAQQPPIRNIPKKRKIRVTTSSTDENMPSTTTAGTKTAGASLKSFTATTPAATSTPVAAIQSAVGRTATDIGKADTKNGSKSKTSTTTTSKSNEIVKKSTPDTNESTKIHIEDIESILSHLHGT